MVAGGGTDDRGAVGGGATGAEEARQPRIVFVGRLSYRANVEAVRWFADAVLPLVAAEHPGVVFDVVGESPHRSLSRLIGPNLQVVGPVPEVAPYYERAAVAVVPVFLATGVQMKLIESLSLGVATVTSTAVASLAGISEPGPCLIADAPDGWAAAVSSLLRDVQHRSEVGRAGRRWAAEHYDSEAIAASLHAIIEEIAAESPPAAASLVSEPAP